MHSEQRPPSRRPVPRAAPHPGPAPDAHRIRGALGGPLAKLIGAPVADILEPLVVGEVRREVGRNGNLVERFPLAIPNGEGLAVPLGSLGSFGARNGHGALVLTVPSPLAPWLSPRLGPDLVNGPVHRPSDGGGVPVADLWVRLRAGARFTLPLGSLGELGVDDPSVGMPARVAESSS